MVSVTLKVRKRFLTISYKEMNYYRYYLHTSSCLLHSYRAQTRGKRLRGFCALGVTLAYTKMLE